MFSNTVMRGKIDVIWKLRDSPLRLIRCGATPLSDSPFNEMSPDVIGKRPLIRLNKVVLPAPFGPMIACR